MNFKILFQWPVLVMILIFIVTTYLMVNDPLKLDPDNISLIKLVYAIPGVAAWYLLFFKSVK